MSNLELSPEDDFKISSFKMRIEASGMGEKATKAMLITIYEAMIHQEIYYKQKIANQWGIKP